MTQPFADQIEVSILGRGYGESIVLHLGDGDWIIVDSFLNRDGVPGALAYLESIGVPPTSISMIVSTHWHDDHIKGMATTYAAASNASIAFSIALNEDEFKGYLSGQKGQTTGPFGSGVDELRKISAIRKEMGRPAPILTRSAHILISKPPENTSFQREVHVRALSPSSQDVADFLGSLGITENEHASRLAQPKRNPGSVVIWAAVGENKILLGADLENSSSENSGWTAIVNSSVKPFGLASVFKVAHHGSNNAHHEGVWETMLAPEPIAALTPFSKGKGLPQESDVQRLKQRTPSVYTAKQSTNSKYKSEIHALEKMIAANGASLKSITKDFGIVRIRKSVQSDESNWDVELINGAVKL